MTAPSEIVDHPKRADEHTAFHEGYVVMMRVFGRGPDLATIVPEAKHITTIWPARVIAPGGLDVSRESKLNDARSLEKTAERIGELHL